MNEWIIVMLLGFISIIDFFTDFPGCFEIIVMIANSYFILYICIVCYFTILVHVHVVKVIDSSIKFETETDSGPEPTSDERDTVIGNNSLSHWDRSVYQIEIAIFFPFPVCILAYLWYSYTESIFMIMNHGLMMTISNHSLIPPLLLSM